MPDPPSAAAPALAGIDVSHYQKNIDWAAVARGGIQYCFIKATEGPGSVDAFFASNWQAARDAGLMRGAYHFFRPKTPASAQADLFVRTVDQLQPGDLPPVLDLEVPNDWANIPVDGRAALAVTWLESVESRLGVTPIVYLSPSFANEILKNDPALARFPLWIAHYTSAAAPAVPKPWATWTFWQYTDKGKPDGVAGFVDSDRFRGSLDELKALAVAVRPAPVPVAPAPPPAAPEDTLGKLTAAQAALRAELATLAALDRPLTDEEITRSHAFDAASQALAQAIEAIDSP